MYANPSSLTSGLFMSCCVKNLLNCSVSRQTRLPYMIDIPTLFIAIVLSSLLIAIILSIVSKGLDSSLPYWAAGFGVHSIAIMLLAMRGLVPDILSVVIGNMLIAASYSFYAFGLSKFLKRDINPLLLYGPPLFIAVSFSLLSDSVAARILLIGLVNTFQSGLILALLALNAARIIGRGKIILGAAFATGGVVAMSRPLAIGLDLVQITSINSPGLFQSLTFTTMLLINLAIALGLVLMQKEHAEAATLAIARTDELTGLPNRRSIYEHIHQAMLESAKNKTFGALLLIDLDNFKTVNDRYGHSCGDELLQHAAARIKRSISDQDSCARLGGDEFVVLLSGLSGNRAIANEQALQKARQLRAQLDQPYVLQEQTIDWCSGSVGLALFEPGITDRQALLRQADQAMYQSKNSVRSQTTQA